MEPPDLLVRYRELRQYVGWSDDDAKRVRAAGPVVQPYFSQIIDDFYGEIGRHPNAQALITGGHDQIRRLKQTLRQWLCELFAGQPDHEYVAARWRIGWRHVEIGLDRIYANAAFSRLRSGLVTALAAGWQTTDQKLVETIGSLNRRLDLDLAIIELAYQTEFIKRQETARALAISEERLRAIVNTCIDAIISIRQDGTIETFNPAAERMFGYAAGEAIGQNVGILMPSPYREEHDGYLRRYLDTGKATIIGIGREVVARRKDGSTFPIELAVSQIDHLRMFIGIIRDVSERKRTEQRLLQSERLAAIGQMITGLAHESRNAFQRSQAALELLEMEVEGNAGAMELIQRIQCAHDHLHHLYEEVRDYASPINLRRRPCDLACIWRDTWLHLEAMRSDKDVQLREMVSDLDLECSVDAHAIEQLFRNILENAIVACREPGEIVIHCARATLEGLDAIRIAIRDNGPGLEREARQKVFQPFFTTKTKGTGLGMAIASRIAEAHGGKIEVGDHPGTGAEFVVTLPRS
jgi:PAS domain S-box-containing protein